MGLRCLLPSLSGMNWVLWWLPLSKRSFYLAEGCGDDGIGIGRQMCSTTYFGVFAVREQKAK